MGEQAVSRIAAFGRPCSSSTTTGKNAGHFSGFDSASRSAIVRRHAKNADSVSCSRLQNSRTLSPLAANRGKVFRPNASFARSRCRFAIADLLDWKTSSLTTHRPNKKMRLAERTQKRCGTLWSPPKMNAAAGACKAPKSSELTAMASTVPVTDAGRMGSNVLSRNSRTGFLHRSRLWRQPGGRPRRTTGGAHPEGGL
jgi:hypothetical protein